MKKISFSALFLFLLTLVNAQDYNNYKPIVCQGEIPSNYLTSSVAKYEKEIKVLEKEDFNRKETKNRKAFVLQTNFVLDNLLQSGMVLFNDEVTNYLNDIAAILAKANPQHKKVNVYTIRSTEVNAFATDRGDIFVTLGLIAQLENEAQLAYILAHEMSHVEEGHSLDLFLESKKINKESNRKKVLEGSVFDKGLLSKCAYSKELEAEADSKGFDLFIQTAYDPKTLLGVFDVLKYSYLPFDEVAFDAEIFQTEFYRFPDNYHIHKTNAIKGVDEYADDSKSTHPSIGSRRSALKARLAKMDFAGKSEHLLDVGRFEHIRTLARFEAPILYLQNDLLAEAIYSSYLLLQKHPENKYLQKCITKALYLNAKYQLSPDYTFKYDYEDIEGELSALYHLLSYVDKKGAAVLALRYSFGVLEKFPNDKEIEYIVHDLFTELSKKHKDSSIFYDDAEKTDPPTSQIDTSENLLVVSKYEKIKQEKGGVGVGGYEYWRYAFVDYLQNEKFKEGYEAGLAELKRQEDIRDYNKSREGYRALKKERKLEERKGHALGIDKVVLVNPTYLQLDVRKNKEGVRYIKTEIGQENLHQIMEEMADRSNLGIEIMDVTDLKKSDVDKFNEIRFLNDWFNDQVRRYDLSLTQGLNQAEVDKIADKYGTDYFLWTGVVSLRERNRKVFWTDAFWLYAFPALPFVIYSKVRPRYDMMYYAILFDIKTGRRQVLKFDFFDKQDTNDLLKAHTFDTFSQISNKRRR